jgi:hypothetical protein
MRTFLVSWSAKIKAETVTEASVKAQAAMKDPDEWQFNASVEDVTEEDEPFTEEEREYCQTLCGNDSPCAVEWCNDFKDRFNKG